MPGIYLAVASAKEHEIATTAKNGETVSAGRWNKSTTVRRCPVIGSLALSRSRRSKARPTLKSNLLGLTSPCKPSAVLHSSLILGGNVPLGLEVNQVLTREIHVVFICRGETLRRKLISRVVGGGRQLIIIIIIKTTWPSLEFLTTLLIS
jgi:hypothetical protein